MDEIRELEFFPVFGFGELFLQGIIDQGDGNAEVTELECGWIKRGIAIFTGQPARDGDVNIFAVDVGGELPGELISVKININRANGCVFCNLGVRRQLWRFLLTGDGFGCSGGRSGELLGVGSRDFVGGKMGFFSFPGDCPELR